MKSPLAIVFDCGATNIRVIAMNTKGEIEASQSYSNKTQTDPYVAKGRIWNAHLIWEKLTKASKIVTSKIDCSRIAGVTTTTFGVDGTFMKPDGTLSYPVISWQCPRTEAVLQHIEKYITIAQLYQISGVQPYAFNTICKLIWLKENHPKIFEDSRFVFMPSIINFFLTGEIYNDATMAGTSMLTDIKKQQFSSDIFEHIGISQKVMTPMVTSGSTVGTITEKASEQTGIPHNIPVIATGHDTQFAVIGSGVKMNEPVLSSGTWEILMARTQQFANRSKELNLGITTEWDAMPNTYNIGINFLASGVIEWVKKQFFGDISHNIYQKMITKAEKVKPFCEGVRFSTDFLGNKSNECGKIRGLTLQTSRGQIYRAVLESLSFQLKEALTALEKAGNFKTEYITCVGSGTKNTLWNQIKADVCNLPLKVIRQNETTALGASAFVFSGSGVFSSVDEALQQIDYQFEMVYPSKNNTIYKTIKSINQ